VFTAGSIQNPLQHSSVALHVLIPHGMDSEVDAKVSSGSGIAVVNAVFPDFGEFPSLVEVHPDITIPATINPNTKKLGDNFMDEDCWGYV
jgi:hypothetical protein